MNVPNETLDRWRRMADAVRAPLNALKRQVRASTPAWELATQADDAARTLGLELERGGAQRPPEHVQRPNVPLELLDTPANRRYLAALQEAWECALAVDRERYGESIGTDGCAQAVEFILCDVQEEVRGPQGAVRE